MLFAVADLPSTRPAAKLPPFTDTTSGAEELLGRLETYDGWAVAVDTRHLPDWGDLPNVTVLTWSRLERRERYSRAQRITEHLVLSRAPGRHGLFGAQPALKTNDVVTHTTKTKPEVWTRWVLAELGADPEIDTVHDLFGTAGITSAFDGMLPLRMGAAA